MVGCAQGRLPADPPRFSNEAALTVVLAARGYPGVVVGGSEIRGIEAAERMPDVTIHYGAARREGARLFAAGGRVLAVTATGPTIAQAQSRAYAAVDMIDWPEGFCRRDIGWRAVARERGE
jgi:phosphoribosylamine--glycine ligase